MKKIILAFFISIIYTTVSAQVKFEAQTERSSYGLNERIQLVFSINNEGDNFVAPKFPGFKAEGPFINKGNQTSITIINGRVNQKREISTQVIYYLTPTKKGTFTIGAASIEYDGTVYKSAPIKITITDPIQMPTYPGQQPTNVNYGEGIHLVAELSTKNPFVNEPVTVVYKLYFEPRSTVGNFRNFKAPKYNDFWSQYIDMKQLRAERGKYNGKDYSMVVLRKVILYPLEAGAKTIEPFKIDLDAEVPTGRRDWFGEYEMRVIEKSLSTGTQTINVKPLPENGKLQVTVDTQLFRGVHYEIIAYDHLGNEWMIHSTRKAIEGEVVGLDFTPEDLHIMRLNETEEEFDARIEEYVDTEAVEEGLLQAIEEERHEENH